MLAILFLSLSSKDKQNRMETGQDKIAFSRAGLSPSWSERIELCPAASIQVSRALLRSLATHLDC